MGTGGRVNPGLTPTPIMSCFVPRKKIPFVRQQGQSVCFVKKGMPSFPAQKYQIETRASMRAIAIVPSVVVVPIFKLKL